MAVTDSGAKLLALHAVRLLGFADTARIARHYALDSVDAGMALLDCEAQGWAILADFAGSAGWSLTDAGRTADEARLSEELDQVGGRETVTGVYRRFLPLNAAFQDAATRWQLHPAPGDPLATNDHTDHRWDDRVLDALASVGQRVVPLEAELVAVLGRFRGYAGRYAHALDQATRGAKRWVDGLGIDSCHVVWMQLHEDLLATLGLARGQEP